jgi:hypothetical protein
VRNQSAATIQHEEDGRSAGLAQYSRRIALVTYYPSNDLLAPLVVENDRYGQRQMMFFQVRRRYRKRLGAFDDRQAFFIERAITRTLHQPVRNQPAVTVQHEADFRSTGLAQRSRRKALAAAQPNDDLFAPLLWRVGLRLDGHREGDEHGNQANPAQHKQTCDS